MHLYSEFIFPRVLDLVMRHPEATRYRRRVVPRASGRVLEIGMGSGLNLPFYDASQIKQLFALEPSPPLCAMAGRRLPGLAFPVSFLESSAEGIPLADRCIDTVVTTWTLCSIPDVRRALAEVARVLIPGGRLLFVEHGFAPDVRVQRWQRRLNPMWGRIAGGCHLDRKIDSLLVTSGFELDALDTGYARGPRPMAFMYCGQAVKPN